MELDIQQFLDGDRLNEAGKRLLAKLLGYLPRIHEGQWGEVYVPLISRLVMVCTDLAIIRDRKVLLKRRKDEHFEGWEAPGGGLGPSESWEVAAKRHAREEFGMEVRFVKVLAFFSNPDNRRAHDVTFLLLCRPESEPREGKWFNICPANLTLEHQKYRLVIDDLLAQEA